MIRKVVFAILVLSVLPHLLFASQWQIGFDAGYLLSGVKASTGYRKDTSYDAYHGYSVSVPLLYCFDGGFAIETGIRLAERSYRYVHTYDGEMVIDVHEHNAYLEIPLIAQKSWKVDRFSFSLGLGGYLGLLVYKAEGGFILKSTSYPDWNLTYFSLKEIDNSDNLFEAGLSVKVSALYEIARNISIFFESRGDFSLTPIERKYQENQSFRYCMSAAFSLGMLYSFGGNS